jgi:hypothetical protein
MDKFVYIDETYANGDGTDSWCSTHIPLPLDIYYQQTYKHPSIGSGSCGMASMQTSIPAYIFQYYDSVSNTSSCTDRDKPFAFPVYFLCKSLVDEPPQPTTTTAPASTTTTTTTTAGQTTTTTAAGQTTTTTAAGQTTTTTAAGQTTTTTAASG